MDQTPERRDSGARILAAYLRVRGATRDLVAGLAVEDTVAQSMPEGFARRG